jgi:membrane protein
LWIALLGSTLRASTTDRVSLAAAGCAFYATLALFPAISVLISVYGLAFNVQAVEQQLQVMRDVLPPPAFAMIDDRVRELVSQPNGTLSIGRRCYQDENYWRASAG